MAVQKGNEKIPIRIHQEFISPPDATDSTKEKQLTTIAAHQDYLKTG